MSTLPASTATATVEPDEQMLVSIVLPVYNEAGNLTPLAREIQQMRSAVSWDAEVLWVDDGSTDGSADQLHHIAQLFADHEAIHLRSNVGQSAALQAGFDAADGDIIVPMDADMQNDPADIPMLIERLQADQLDCVAGVRQDRDDPLAKRVPSRIQTALTRRMCPDAGSDMGCTLKAFRADALDTIDLRGEQHRYIPALLAQQGYQLDEMVVNHRPRGDGESSYGAGRLLRGFLDAVYHLLMSRYAARPIHLFGSVGLLMLSLGGLLGGHMLVKRLVLFQPISQHMPRLVLISILTLGGLLVLCLGILAELTTRLLYQEQRPYAVREVVR